MELPALLPAPQRLDPVDVQLAGFVGGGVGIGGVGGPGVGHVDQQGVLALAGLAPQDLVAGDRPGVRGGGVPAEGDAAVDYPGGQVGGSGGVTLGVYGPGNEQRGGDEGRPDEEQGERRAAQGESHDAPPGLCKARKMGREGGGGGGEHLCEKARSEAVAEPERAGAPAVSSAFMGLSDVMAVTPFNVEVP